MNYKIIAELKKKKGLTNPMISEMTGITVSTLDKITSGVNVNPKLETLQALAKVLGCTLDDFSDSPHAERRMPEYSAEALAIAKIYDSLDAHGKRMIRLVADLEAERCDSHMDPMSDVDADFREQMSSKGRLASQAE